MTRYVQHKSGMGEKWEVRNEYAITWDCTGADNYALYLPKSEYIEVPAPVMPDRWVDVTADCTIAFNGEIWHDYKNVTFYASNSDKQEPDRVYRLRKVQHGQFGWAFIVERKEP